MLTRDPDAFLFSLKEAFGRRQEKDKLLLPAILCFFLANKATILRMKAVDELADKFEKFANQPNRSQQQVNRLPEEDQLLFDFFSNGLSALESFIFGSYYLGVGIDGKSFDINTKSWKITPAAVLESFKAFDPTASFTLSLEEYLSSPEYNVIKAMRISMVPGRTIRVMRPQFPNIIDLDLWYESIWSRAMGGAGIPEPSLAFSLEPDALSNQRDRIDEQLELLSKALCDLASAHEF